MITDNFFPGMLDDDDAPRQAAGFNPRPLYRIRSLMIQVEVCASRNHPPSPPMHACVACIHRQGGGAGARTCDARTLTLPSASLFNCLRKALPRALFAHRIDARDKNSSGDVQIGAFQHHTNNWNFRVRCSQEERGIREMGDPNQITKKKPIPPPHIERKCPPRPSLRSLVR